MKPTFDHFVITRFNVRLPWLSRFDAESRFCNPDWLKGRIDLFENYCYPSMTAQTSQRYTWLVFFDIDSPPFLKDAIRGWQHFTPFTPCYVDGFSLDELRGHIRARTTPSHTHVLTTRLDSDDMLADTFIQQLQDSIPDLETAFLNVLHGFQFHNGKVYTVSHASNAFISLYEPKTTLDTVLCVAHGDAGNHAQVVDHTEQRLWAQIIHGGNVANELDAGGECFPLWLAARNLPPLRRRFRASHSSSLVADLATTGRWLFRKICNRIQRVTVKRTQNEL